MKAASRASSDRSCLGSPFNFHSDAVDDGHSQQARQRRKASYPPAGESERASPQLQQPIVSGRVDVGRGVCGDLGKAALRQRPGVALVMPE